MTREELLAELLVERYGHLTPEHHNTPRDLEAEASGLAPVIPLPRRESA